MTVSTAISHVVVYFDGSRDAPGAVEHAVRVASAHDARVTAVVLVEHEQKAVGCCFPADAWNRELDAIAAREVDEARGALRRLGSNGEVVVSEGRGAAGICCAASQFDCDAIVIPGSGRRSRRLRAAIQRRTSSRVLAEP